MRTVRADEIRPGDTVQAVSVTAWGSGTFTFTVDYVGAVRYVTITRDGTRRRDVDPSMVEITGRATDDGRPCRIVKAPHHDATLAAEGPYHGLLSRTCERCGAGGALYDAHGWYCQQCRDQDAERATTVDRIEAAYRDGRLGPYAGLSHVAEAVGIDTDATTPDEVRELDNEARAHLDALTTITAYRLTCGHAAQVPGEHGATTGRAWCVSCGESVAVAHVLPMGIATAESEALGRRLSD